VGATISTENLGSPPERRDAAALKPGGGGRPERQGFGSRLITRLAASLSGDTTFAWLSCGLQATLRWGAGAPAGDAEITAVSEDA
jgi:hypothetical protein